MKRITIVLVLILLLFEVPHAQVAINTDQSQPDASAMLDVKSTEQGFLPPRLTSAQRDAISSPAEGLTIFNTDSLCLEFWDGSAWFDICTGNSYTPPSYPSGTIHCIPGGSDIVDVLSTTGATWMDRNLGASQQATSSTDAASYGDLYQWGRFSEGHQCRTSSTTSTNATTAVPNEPNPSWDGLFITEPNSPYDWLTPQDGTLWQGTNGTNNPCPTGYRLPTETELLDEFSSWAPNYNATGAYASPLKLPVAGYRLYSGGSLSDVGSFGYYCSSTVNGIYLRYLGFYSSNAQIGSWNRAGGYSLRCLKD